MRTLYKLSTTGKLLKWSAHASGPTVIQSHGEVGGKITHQPYVAKPKNVGKKTETTAEAQAEKEVEQLYTKKLKEGYVDSMEKAKAGKTDSIIKGGIKCMLAHKFDEQKHKMSYPAFVQPKLDGIRCLAHVTSTGVTLWSRTQKQFVTLAHIETAIYNLTRYYFRQGGEDFYFDGELYNHKYKDNFSEIASLASKKTLNKDDETKVLNLEYHIYDIYLPDEPTYDFSQRVSILEQYNFNAHPYLKLVFTHIVSNEHQVIDWQRKFIEKGFEGAMVRGFYSPYECKRSYNLQKVKTFQDEEFKIVTFELSKDEKSVIAVCALKNGETFKATMRGNKEENVKKFYDQRARLKGKKLTVKFQSYTEYNVPRFPVGVAVRDYE